MTESVFHAEDEEPVATGIQGADGCTGTNRRSAEKSVREFEPRAATTHEWVRQAATGDGYAPSRLRAKHVISYASFAVR